MEGSRIFRTFRRKMPYHTDQKKDLYFKAFRGRITSVLSKKEPMTHQEDIHELSWTF